MTTKKTSFTISDDDDDQKNSDGQNDHSTNSRNVDPVSDRVQDEEKDNMFQILANDADISASRFDDDEQNADDAYHAVEKETSEDEGVHEEETASALDD